ncbi:hypothetical protein ACQP2P_43375 [Dactylosporangium sp. CA-139114]|uniref:hypothetical protein n=1 Tax=Dactylosporangium sp. CA-139114 TaxID=3239931 RepID=UPI003D96FB1E
MSNLTRREHRVNNRRVAIGFWACNTVLALGGCATEPGSGAGGGNPVYPALTVVAFVAAIYLLKNWLTSAREVARNEWNLALAKVRAAVWSTLLGAVLFAGVIFLVLSNH